jgi:hypothetical protein
VRGEGGARQMGILRFGGATKAGASAAAGAAGAGGVGPVLAAVSGASVATARTVKGRSLAGGAAWRGSSVRPLHCNAWPRKADMLLATKPLGGRQADESVASREARRMCFLLRGAYSLRGCRSDEHKYGGGRAKWSRGAMC